MIHWTPQTRKIDKLIAPAVKDMGYEIVRIMMVGVGSGKPTLQIMAENSDGTMGVEDCTRLSQAVSAILDVENVISDAYFLEVSSPGIDRPLTREKDFDKYKDLEARIEVDRPIDGQKKFKGMLKGINGDLVSIDTDEKPIQIPFQDIIKAKLLLTDSLIKSIEHKEG